MITLELSTTGPQLANQLAQNDEEFAYFLVELCDEYQPERLKDAVDHIVDRGRAQEIAAWLREFAQMLENSA